MLNTYITNGMTRSDSSEKTAEASFKPARAPEFVHNCLLCPIISRINESNMLVKKTVLSTEVFETEPVMHKGGLPK